MTELITRIIKYLIENHSDDYPNCKYLMIEINDTNKYMDGNIQVNATGSWIKKFYITKFTNEWRNFNQNISIHYGNNNTKQYGVYRIKENIMLELEEEPFVDNWEYYLSFIFEISKKILKNKFPIIKKYIKMIADNYTDIKINLIGSDIYWQDDTKVNKCLKLISESITTILIHDSTNKSKEVMEKYLGASTSNAISEKLDNILPELLYQYNEEDFKI